MDIRTYRADAIVLRRIYLGETDKIVTLYTREKGKLSAVAKGARRTTSRLAGATELMAYTRVFLAAGQNLDILTQAETKAAFLGIRSDIARAAYATYLLELVSEFVEEREPNQDLFDTLLSALYLLENKLDPEIVARWFELQAMSILGYRPQAEICLHCGKNVAEQEHVVFSPSLGGTVCPECSGSGDDSIEISGETAAFLTRLLAAEPQEIRSFAPSVVVRKQLAKAMRWHIRYRAERDLKSLDFILSLPTGANESK